MATPAGRWPLFLRYLVQLVLVGLVCLAGALGLFSVIIYELQFQALRSHLLTVVRIGAPLVDGETLDRVRTPEDENGPAYLAILQVLRSIQAADEEIKFIYTMRRSPQPGIVTFIVDAQESKDTDGNGMIDPDEERAAIGETYNAAQLAPNILKGFDEPKADEEAVTDKWGTQLSAYAPIRDRHGQVVGILGVDIDASSMVHMKQRLLRQGATLYGGFALPWILLSAWLARRLVRRLTPLRQVMAELTTGQLEVQLPPASSDELGLLGQALAGLADSLRERNHYLAVLERYVSPSVAQEILRSTGEQEPRATRRRATVMFADLSHFSRISAPWTPDQTLTFLNGYFERMTDIVFAHGGTMDKFLGDGFLAIFGAPAELENPECRALEAALAIREEVERLRVERQVPELRIAIGINSGMVIAGSIGSPRRMEYTVIGEEVNLANRLHILAGELEEPILVSDAIQAVTKQDFAFARVERVLLPTALELQVVFVLRGHASLQQASLRQLPVVNSPTRPPTLGS